MTNQLDIFNPLDEEHVTSWARFSSCRRWRWELGRTWTRRPMLGTIGLNPSDADETDDDPTVRRWIGFAKREGFGGIVVCNLFGWITTDPRGLRKTDDPVGSDNDAAIRGMADSCRAVLISWGGLPAKWMVERGRYIISMLRESDARILCLGRTKKGNPKHPLYLRADTPMEPYVEPA